MAIPELTEDEAQQEAFMQSVNFHVDSDGPQNSELQIGLTTSQDLVAYLWQLRPRD